MIVEKNLKAAKEKKGDMALENSYGMQTLILLFKPLTTSDLDLCQKNIDMDPDVCNPAASNLKSVQNEIYDTLHLSYGSHTLFI